MIFYAISHLIFSYACFSGMYQSFSPFFLSILMSIMSYCIKYGSCICIKEVEFCFYDDFL